MGVHAWGSAKGSPGVTTSVLALAWVWPAVTGRRVLVVDADLAGSGILPGLLHRAPHSPGGLLALAATRPDEMEAGLPEALVGLDETTDRMVLTGVSDPGQCAALEHLWPHLPRLLSGLGEVDVLVDAGRPGTGHPLWDRADTRTVVTRAALASVAAARSLLRTARDARLLVVGPGRPYSVRQIEAAVHETGSDSLGERSEFGGTDPAVGSLPWDRSTAAVFSAGDGAGWRFTRSPLLRAAAALASDLARTDAPVAGVA